MKNFNTWFSVVLFVGIFCLAPAQYASAQDDSNEKIYTVVEQLPQYLDGGDEGMYSFLAQNVKYPAEAIEKGIEGRVFVSFIIDQQGKNQNAKVEKGIGGGCDEEALRVVKLLNNWAPAKQNGRVVTYRYIVPINRFIYSSP